MGHVCFELVFQMEGCLRPRARDACLLQRALGLTGNHAAWKEWLRVPTCIPSWRQPIPGESGYVAATQSNRTSSTAALAALTHRVSGPAGRIQQHEIEGLRL